LLHLFTWTKS